jgi:hypothetical protein
MDSALQTVEGVLESCLQSGQSVKIVLGGRVDAPLEARILRRNGQTFEIAVLGSRVAVEVAQVGIWLG